MCEHTEQLERIEAKLDRIAGFCALVEQLAAPWIGKRAIGRLVRGRLRVDTDWQVGDERN